MQYGIINIESENFAQSKKIADNLYFIRVKLGEDGSGFTQAIEAVVTHEPTEEDFDGLLNSYIDGVKRHKIGDVETYDKSDNVNGFIINGEHAWFDKTTRMGIINLLECQQKSGETFTTIDINDKLYELTISRGLEMMQQLEVYAGQCFLRTAIHKKNIQALDSVSDIVEYDITDGYPEQLEFTLVAL